MRVDTIEIQRFADMIRAEFPDDETLLADMLEGETDLHFVIGRLLAADAEAGAYADANRALVALYQARVTAASERSKRLRLVMQRVIDATGLRKITHEYGTLSLRAVSARPVFDGDVTDLPLEFQRVTIAPDLVAIKDALTSGREVPGAHMGNGGETISIRRA
jgi:hypothetical protein